MLYRFFMQLLSFNLGKKEFFYFWNKLYRLSLKGMNIGTGYSVNKSGEKVVMQYLKKISKKKFLIIFDVGANVGNYTNALLNIFGKNCEIHCFEPAKDTFLSLQHNIKADNVKFNNFGLSNKEEAALLYYEKKLSPIASLYKRQLDYIGGGKIKFTKSEKVLLDTVDHYCQKKQIKFIDFLKIDVEGNELQVLIGAAEMLKHRKIRMIQFEFGGGNIDSRTFIRDFWNLLNSRYRIYLIMKNGFSIINHYDELLENFTCSNYFCVLK